jgi:hypothetical protein
MRLSTCLSVGIAALGLSLFAADARADEPGQEDPTFEVTTRDDAAPVHKGRGAGLALTITGASFLGASALATVGTVIVMFTTGGWGTLILGSFGAMVAVGTSVVGVSMLIPGIVLLNKSRGHERVWAEAASSHPTFEGVPALSARF